MEFTAINTEIIEKLASITGKEAIFTDKEVLAAYSHDRTEDLLFFPELVLKPKTTTEIAQILRYCNKKHIAVTVRGAGTGLSGGALPVFGGVLVSMEKFNRIIAIDEDSLQATLEPGVITQVLMNAVEEKGLYYPVDPGSKGSCFIGGNISYASGGPRVVKYGTLREYILNLEVVLPNGDIIWTGANTLKYASGYNLTQLMIGSEGTLGVITKVVVKLIPKPLYNIVLFASFPQEELACAAVSAIFRAGITPSAVEFIERKGIEWICKYDDTVNYELKENDHAFLLIEIDGKYLEHIYTDCEIINKVLENYNCSEVLFADTAVQKEELWRIRRNLPASINANTVKKEEDTVVPRAKLPVLLKGIKEIGVKYGFQSICYGHAGDGNLHVNIIKEGLSDKDWNTKLKKGIREIFELTVSLGGTISGEHGIGLVQKEYMDIRFSEAHLNLMRGIKKVFDPNGILNPGKIF